MSYGMRYWLKWDVVLSELETSFLFGKLIPFASMYISKKSSPDYWSAVSKGSQVNYSSTQAHKCAIKILVKDIFGVFSVNYMPHSRALLLAPCDVYIYFLKLLAQLQSPFSQCCWLALLASANNNILYSYVKVKTRDITTEPVIQLIGIHI